jgi:hypothetical protein
MIPSKAGCYTNFGDDATTTSASATRERSENAHVLLPPQLWLMVALVFLHEICIPLLTPDVSWPIYSNQGRVSPQARASARRDEILLPDVRGGKSSREGQRTKKNRAKRCRSKGFTAHSSNRDPPDGRNPMSENETDGRPGTHCSIH